MLMLDPGPVSPGSECQTPPDEVGIDWLSVTFGGETESAVRAWLKQHHDDDAGMPCKGREGFKRAEQWATGAQLLSGHRSERGWLLLSGAACRLLGGAAVHDLARVALMGGKCRRIDIRRDLRGEGLTLITDIRAACEAGFLHRVKRFKSFVEREANDGQLVGDGMYLGSSSSPRFVRVYDKGLEQKTSGPGEWLRFELQLRDEIAEAAAVEVFGSARECWHGAALNVIRGAVDFREGRSGDGVKWERWPRCAFWSRFTEGEGCRPMLAGEDVDAQRWCDWLRSSMGAFVLACDQAGLDIGEAAVAVLADVRITEGTIRNPVVPKLSAFLAELTGVSKSDTLGK